MWFLLFFGMWMCFAWPPLGIFFILIAFFGIIASSGSSGQQEETERTGPCTHDLHLSNSSDSHERILPL